MIGKIVGTGIFLSLITLSAGLSELYGQQDEGERRFSITLHSGALLASGGQGTMGALAGNFNVESDILPFFGAGIHYALSPAWSIAGSFHTGKFENRFDADPFYSTEFTSISLRTVSNINNLFNLRWSAARVINPYFFLGIGGIHGRVLAEDLDSRDLSLNLLGGLGLSVYVTRSIDLFAQYDYYVVGGDLLDGFSGEGGSDQYATAGGGIRINFGRGNTNLVSWPPPERRIPEPEPAPEPQPVPEPEPEIEDEMSLSEEAEVWLGGLANFLTGPLMNRLTGLSEAKARAAQRAQMRREERRRAAAAEPVITDEPSGGHYLQVYSLRSRESAEAIRNEVINALEGVISNPPGRVIIHRYDGYHRILTGPFASVSQVMTVLRTISDSYPEAFVITYPRR